MNKIVLRFSLVGAIVVASVAVPLLIQHHARIQWREQKALLRGQAERFAELSAENKRLSNLVAQNRNSSLSNDEFMELLKLRGEIGQWRQKAREVARLQAKHQQLLVASESSEPQPDQALPDPQTVLAYWPKAQLTSAGYAEPASALQTAFWTMNRNDPNALAASVTPEAKSDLESRYIGDTPADKLADGTKWVADSLGPSSGFYVVGQEWKSQDHAILDVYFEKEGATRGFALKKIAGQWKLDRIYILGMIDVDQPPRRQVWP